MEVVLQEDILVFVYWQGQGTQPEQQRSNLKVYTQYQQGLKRSDSKVRDLRIYLPSHGSGVAGGHTCACLPSGLAVAKAANAKNARIVFILSIMMLIIIPWKWDPNWIHKSKCVWLIKVPELKQLLILTWPFLCSLWTSLWRSMHPHHQGYLIAS